jgi:acetyl/propionyl-CoA carboxylase alpha subunit/acetyl-CoA carboxylase carboxyltransferase component
MRPERPVVARPIERLAIVTRGAPAVRFIRAAREHAREHGRDLRVIAVHADAEGDALFVRSADEAASLHDHRDPGGGGGSLSAGMPPLELVEAALLRSRADGAWVGWGPLAQVPAFADLCDRHGLVNVGPSGDALRRLCDRAALADLAEQAGVPLADEAAAVAPVVRQLEVLVVADDRGTAWAVDVHDGTLQRRTEKVLVESAAGARAGVDLGWLRATAGQLLTRVGFTGAGMVTFVRPGNRPEVALLRVSVGVPLGHGITEMTTGLDLAKLQLHLAEGGRLEGLPRSARGHAISVRLNAEDAEAALRPAPGTVDLLQLPSGPGIRVDTGVTEGANLALHPDPTIAEVVAWGRDREEARVRLHLAVSNLLVVLQGGTTNKGFLLDLLERPELLTGAYDTAWLDQVASAGGLEGVRHADLAVLVAAVDAADVERRYEQTQLFASAARGRPQTADAVGRTIELDHRGHRYAVHVTRVGRRRYALAVDGTRTELLVTRLGPHQSRVEVGSRSLSVVSAVQGGDLLAEVDGVPHRLRRRDGGVVRAPSPGVVVRVAVAAGHEVAAGETVAVLESMKMERSIAAPFAGRVRQVTAGTNVQVDAGASLLELDPAGREQQAPTEPRLRFPDVAEAVGTGPSRCRHGFDVLRRFVLGFDIDAADARRIARRDAADGDDDARSREVVLEGEIAVLGSFADLRALFRTHREPGHDDEDPWLARSPEAHLYAYMRSVDTAGEGLPGRFLRDLDRALARYGVASRERSPALEEALFWIFRAQRRVTEQVPVIVALLQRWHEQRPDPAGPHAAEVAEVLDRLVAATLRTQPQVGDLAREVRYRLFDALAMQAARRRSDGEVDAHIEALTRSDLSADERAAHLDALVAFPTPLAPRLLGCLVAEPDRLGALALELLTRRYYRLPSGQPVAVTGDGRAAVTRSDGEDGPVEIVTVWTPPDEIAGLAATLAPLAADLPERTRFRVDVCTWLDARAELDPLMVAAREALTPLARIPTLEHVSVATVETRDGEPSARVHHVTFRAGTAGGLEEDRSMRDLQPMMATRLALWRYANFDLQRLDAEDGVHLYRGVARTNPKDERLFAIAEVRTLTPVHDDEGRLQRLVEVEWALTRAFAALRGALVDLPAATRPVWNRVTLHVWPTVDMELEELEAIARELAPGAAGLGLEEVDVSCRRPDPDTGEPRDRRLRLTGSVGAGFTITQTDPPSRPLEALDEYTQKVVRCRRRGTPYPYELLELLTARGAGGLVTIRGGSFVEHDLDDAGRLVAVPRPPGHNRSGIVVGIVSNTTARYPEGMARVALLGDPTRALGAITVAECDRIVAALDLAEQRGLPVEWFALSAGARIALDSGTENMDGVAVVLRRLIEFTQGGGEVNVVVTGINVGAQPYWNAEATMLMHTKGILVMTPDSAMVLTGKQALDYSGSVSAEDNVGIGGYERVMGPNGQAQYWAPGLAGACRVLLRHYEHSYVAPGERFPRRAPTRDPRDRDVRASPHRLAGSGLTAVGDVFDATHNPDRKQPFDIRSVMRAVLDRDHEPMERWADLIDGDTAVVWDAHLGGIPVAAIGLEAHSLPRHGLLPADGPDQWTSGTLFPTSSRKVARAVNAASGTRPLVILANLSGFDGSPESLRRRQLEYGAEIGRAVVNFRGPIVFCVVSRYHGGAFVVFSQRLNENLVTLAVEGSHASVIGGAPAAAVVFAGEVTRRAQLDARVQALTAEVDAATGADRAHLRTELAALTAAVRSEKLGELAAEFDAIHSVERAREVGSVSDIIPAAALRPRLIEAVERGIERELERVGRER